MGYILKTENYKITVYFTQWTYCWSNIGNIIFWSFYVYYMTSKIRKSINVIRNTDFHYKEKRYKYEIKDGKENDAVMLNLN